MKSFPFVVLVLALATMQFTVAYPSVTIVTDTNTYSTGAPMTVVAGSTSDPYVSGADYGYSLSRTYDFVDGYRVGYTQASADLSHNSLNHYYGPGMDCDANRNVCFYRYEPCGDRWCRAGDPWQRTYYDTNIVYAQNNLYSTVSYSYYTTQRIW